MIEALKATLWELSYREWCILGRGLLGIAFTYLVAPILLACLIASWRRIFPKHVPLFLIACFGAAPMICGWICHMLEWCLPAITPDTCLFVVGFVALVGVGALIARRSTLRRNISHLLGGWNQLEAAQRALDCRIIVVIFFAGAIAWYVSVTQVIIGTDYAYYFVNARFFFEGISVWEYPFRHPPTPTDYHFPSSHPLGFHFLIYWSYVTQGSSNTTFVARCIGPFYFVLTGLLIWSTTRRVGLIGALISPVLFLTITAIVRQSAESGPIDIVLTFFQCLSILLIVEAALTRSRNLLVAAGFAVGFASYSHSIGVLAFVYAPVVYLATAIPKHGWKQWKPLFIQACVPVIVALVFFSWQYLNNTLATGKPVGDDAVVWDALGSRASDVFRYERRLGTFSDRIVYGLFQIWSKPELFGYAGWFFLASLLAFPMRLAKNVRTRAALIIVGIFMSLSLATMMIGSHLIIKNFRYLLTILPFVVIVAAFGTQMAFLSLAHFVSRFYSFQNRSTAVALCIQLVFGILAFCVIFFSINQWSKRQFQSWLKTGRASVLREIVLIGDLDGILSEPPTAMSEFLREVDEKIPHEAVTLIFYEDTFRFYLQNHTVIGHFSPHLVPFMSLESTEEAVSLLEEMNVEYVTINGWTPPALTSSVLNDALADPRYFRLEYDSGGYRIFRLKRRPQMVLVQLENLAPSLTGIDGAIVTPAKTDSNLRDSMDLMPNRGHVFSCKIKGEGLAKIIIYGGEASNHPIEGVRLWSGLIDPEGSEINLQFMLPDSAANHLGFVEDVRFGIELTGSGGEVFPVIVSRVEARADSVAGNIISSLDANFPGRGVLDYPNYPIGDVPKAYAMLLKAEIANDRSAGPNPDDVIRTCGNWLIDNHDLNDDGISGWGLPVAWDAFGDDTVNPVNTSYTITTAIVIDALLDWAQHDPEAPVEEIQRLIKASFEPYLKPDTPSPSGMAPYSLAPSDRKFNCFNPAMYLAGQAQRVAKWEPYQQSHPESTKSLTAFADQNVQVAIDKQLFTPSGNWYWTYSLEESTPNDMAHAGYIIYGLQEYIAHDGRLSTQLDEPKIVGYLNDFRHSDEPLWAAWPPFYKPIEPVTPRTYGFGMAIFLAAKNGNKQMAESLVAEMLVARREDGLFYKRALHDKTIINEYQAYAALGLMYCHKYILQVPK